MRLLILSLQKLKLSLRSKLALAFASVLLLFILNGLISLLPLNALRTTQQQQEVLSTELGRLQNYEVAFRGELSVYNEIIFVSKVTTIRNPYTNAILDSIYSKNNNNPDAQSQRLAQLYLVAHDHFQAMEQFIRKGDFESASQVWAKAKPDFDITRIAPSAIAGPSTWKKPSTAAPPSMRW